MSWNCDIPWSLNSSDTFPRRKFENWPPRSCRPGPILSISTISFELHAKVAEEIYLEMCIYGQLSEVQMVRDLDLDVGSGQGHINIHSTRSTTMPKHANVASRSTEIRPFEFCEISTNGEVWTLVIAFLGRNWKNRAPTSCSLGPILWPPAISYELHAKPAEEIDLEMCNYGQLSEVQILRDLDFGSDQGHINVHSTSSTISMPNHVTVAWHSTEMWPFEFCEIWTQGEVWTLVIAFLEGY